MSKPNKDPAAELDKAQDALDILCDVIRAIQRALDETPGDDGLVETILADHGVQISPIKPGGAQ